MRLLKASPGEKNTTQHNWLTCPNDSSLPPCLPFFDYFLSLGSIIRCLTLCLHVLVVVRNLETQVLNFPFAHNYLFEMI